MKDWLAPLPINSGKIFAAEFYFLLLLNTISK